MRMTACDLRTSAHGAALTADLLGDVGVEHKLSCRVVHVDRAPPVITGIVLTIYNDCHRSVQRGRSSLALDGRPDVGARRARLTHVQLYVVGCGRGVGGG